MEFTATQLAQALHGKVMGEALSRVKTISRIEHGKPGSLCFLANPKYEHYLYTTQASVVLINETFVPKEPVNATLVVVPDAYQAIAQALALFQEARKGPKGRSWRASVAWTARLGKGVYVGPYTVVGRHARIGEGTALHPQVWIGDHVTVGKHCIIYPGVKIYPHCKIGDHCILHAGAVIGSDGFGFAPDAQGVYHKIPQTGNVTIEDHVEIGANTVVDRATMETTHIGKGVKIDNLVQVAHNVSIGENTVIAAQSGFAGSSKIGKNCQFAGQTGVAGHISICDGTRVGAQAGVLGSINAPDTVVMGTPAFAYKQYLKAYAKFKKSAQ